MTDPDNIFENIIVAAKRSIDWKLNLILTPAELGVLVAEITRLKAILGEFSERDDIAIVALAKDGE